MHRSHWDIEVYAKDFQERRAQEAARRRLADEAVAGRAMHSVADNPFNLAIARFLSDWKTKIASTRAANAPRPVAEQMQTVDPEVAPQPFRAPRGRLAQPYADMVVVARGAKVGVVEQPSVVSDC